MAKEFAKKFYNSKKWKNARNAYVQYRTQVDGGTCEECREKVGYIVHHRTELTEFNIGDPDIALSFDNFKYVCKQCHDDYDGHWHDKKHSGLLVYFDKEGNPISKRDIDRMDK